jgi:hypothetical protein
MTPSGLEQSRSSSSKSGVLKSGVAESGALFRNARKPFVEPPQAIAGPDPRELVADASRGPPGGGTGRDRGDGQGGGQVVGRRGGDVAGGVVAAGTLGRLAFVRRGRGLGLGSGQNTTWANVGACLTDRWRGCEICNSTRSFRHAQGGREPRPRECLRTALRWPPGGGTGGIEAMLKATMRRASDR